nr:protein phosphatase 1 regulatory subunit 26-like [Nerophis lumbriciformis]
MYLMNAPTVAAPHTEWRACGPPGGCSIPISYSDSDAELSARSSSISNKVQMIIESLRSCQSSLEMDDKVKANVLQRQDGPPEACKAVGGSLVTAKSKTKKRPACVPFKDSDQASDTDDSVDKGIEEAILEYLKERDGHKRKAEPFVQSSTQTVGGIKSESQPFSIMRSHCPQSVIQATAATIPVKKYIKHKASLHEEAFRNSELARVMLKDQATNTTSLVCKVEDCSNDSSSDDGIEEAIQRYQLERIEQQTRGDTFKPLASAEESDSSSDDGIEEAIRHYQLEQLREKSVSKPQDKSVSNASATTVVDYPKRNKAKKKPAVKSAQPPSPSVFSASLNVNQKGQGNESLSFKVEGFTNQPPKALPKANTTAELMCAEAILDISKTVMPGIFTSHLNVGPSNCSPAEPTRESTMTEDNGDVSSIDSEDGIEQEIMKFLEEKAQMLKCPPGESGATMTTREVTKKKSPRLSLTQRRKQKGNTTSSLLAVDSSTKHFDLQRSRDKTEQSGDKSSSLDSDEDLDTAIKALLKTKKKSKRMTKSVRDSRKRLMEEAGPSRDSAKKAKYDPLSKPTILRKSHKKKSDSKDTLRSSKKTVPLNTVASKTQVNCCEKRVPELPRTAHQIKEESSSVDSDDGIEQEIQKFLAEKAEKVPDMTNNDTDIPGNGTTSVDCTPLRGDLEKENQLAEIPRQSVSPLSQPKVTTPNTSALPAIGSLWSCSPRISAWSARTEQKMATPVRAVDDKTEKILAQDQSLKWRQSFGLPAIDPKSFNPTMFHISSSKMSAGPSQVSQRNGVELKPSPPANLWSSTRRSWSTDKTKKTPVTNPASNPFSVVVTARQRQGAASTVHMPRDKSVFVELESGRTNHVQVQSRQSDEGKARTDEGRDARDVQLQGAEEEFIDVSEGESPEKKKSTLSLSCSIDPGFVSQPYIALTTEERSRMFRKRCTKETNIMMLRTKRKLQFVPAHRSTEKSGMYVLTR